MPHLNMRHALLALALGLSAPAMAQQSPLPGPQATQTSGNTTTTFTPIAPPIYQSNATHGQLTGQVPPMAGVAQPSDATRQSSVAPLDGLMPQAMDTGPKTAAEQGYDPSALAAQAAARRALEEAKYNDNARQRGERIAAPEYRNTVARNPADAEWLINWKHELVEVGVHPDKVDFEAGRLPHDQFELWASRMIWALAGKDYHSSFDRPQVSSSPAPPAAPAPCCVQASPCCR